MVKLVQGEVNKMAKGIKVNPTIIQWAVQSSGKSLSQVSEKFNKIGEWTADESELTVSELNKLSKELRIPFGYFFLKKPPVETIELLKYRTIDNEEHEKPSRDLVDTIKCMERRQSFMRETLVEDGFSPLKFVNSASLKDDSKVLAKKIISELSMAPNWNKKSKDTFNILKNAVNKIGILIMQNGIVGNNTNRALDLSEFRAFVLIDKYAPLIFINTKDSMKAKTFSLCHELVHVWLGINELYNDNFQRDQSFFNEKLEKFCNEVAAEMLLPEETIVTLFRKDLDAYSNVKMITNEYNVSDLVACIRMKDKSLISRNEFEMTYKLLVKEMQENLKLKEKSLGKSGGNFYNTQGSRLDLNFVRAVDRKAKEGKILYTEAYSLVGARGKTYDKLIKHLEGR